MGWLDGGMADAKVGSAPGTSRWLDGYNAGAVSGAQVTLA